MTTVRYRTHGLFFSVQEINGLAAGFQSYRSKLIECTLKQSPSRDGVPRCPTGRYELEVIDIHQQLALAMGDQIIAVPTLLRKPPNPLRTLIGDMSDEQRVLIGLDLRPGPTRRDAGEAG